LLALSACFANQYISASLINLAPWISGDPFDPQLSFDVFVGHMAAEAGVEFRDLRWALVASRHRSLRRAAQALGIRQSTLSRGLRDLECRLGVVLFERSNGGTTVTGVGREFLEFARRITEEADAAFSRLKSHRQGVSGRLTIGVHTSFAAGNLRASLVEHRRQFPDVRVRTVDGRRNDLLCGLADGAVDVALLAGNRASWADCALPLWSERVIVALPAGHALGVREAIRWDELKSERLLLSERGACLDFEHLLMAKAGGFDSVRILRQDAGLDRLMSLVGADFGILFVLEGATGARYDGVAYRELHDEDGPIRLNFTAYWRENNSNPTLAAFLAILRARYPDLTATPIGG
jgi:DNA-binding transcriptional LysR family regulator